MDIKEGTKFTINGQMIKIYLGYEESVHELVEAYHLHEVLVVKEPSSCIDVKQALLERQPKVYYVANNRFYFLCENCRLFVLFHF